MKIVNFYIQVPQGKEVELALYLHLNGFAFYDATDFDSCTSGFNKLDTLDEIEAAVEGK